MLTIKNQSCIRWHGGHANKKIRIGQNSILLVLTMAMVTGCSPNGPRALIQGKRLIEEGKYAQAVEKLQTATSLMATNSHAWNYLGLAYHYSKQPAPAEKAYQRALSLNSDLPEASYNLGCLWLEQNRVEAAKSQFVTYTLRRGSAPEGFLKLGTAQLRAAAALTSIPQRSSSLLTAEKTFEDALRLSPQNAEAINNLGVARYERGRTSEGVRSFRQALQIHPKYRPALLNLAVSSQLSKDSRGAIEYYKQFLASSPPPDSQSQGQVPHPRPGEGTKPACSSASYKCDVAGRLQHATNPYLESGLGTREASGDLENTSRSSAKTRNERASCRSVDEHSTSPGGSTGSAAPFQ